MRFMLRFSLAVGCSLLYLGALHAADTRDDAAAARLVRQAFDAELAGKGAERGELLMRALALDPKNKQARWQLGYVRVGDQWVKIDDVPQRQVDDGALAAYRAKRDALVDTADNQRELARWCRKRGLAGEARVHWTKLLEYEPQDPEALAALGLKWHAERLLTQAQITAERAESGKRLEAFRRYRPQALKWRAAIIGSNREKADAALAALDEIDDLRALEAVESVFVGEKATDPRLDLALIEAAARLPDPGSTEVLLRRALAGHSADAVSAACDALKRRPLYTFVPQLLALMPGKTETKFALYTLPNGSVLHEHEVSYTDARGKTTLGYQSSVTPTTSLKHIVGPLAAADEARKGELIERQARAQASLNEARREQITEILTRTTGFQDPEDPELWNQQYADYYGWGRPAANPERRVDVGQHVTVYPIPEPRSGPRTAPPTPRPTGPESNLRRIGSWRMARAFTGECFAAGTQVTTLAGPRAIESIRPGDRVLAQDIASGEIAYQTVTQRTLRKSVRLLRLHVGDQTLDATYGHPFWVVGEGWHVASHLEPGMRLRGLSGDVTVDRIEPIAPAEVYNLLVNDFGTYFVGSGQLLVHDDSPPQASAELVPGLASTSR